MLKRNLAVLLIAGLVLGGGAAAWARSDASRPTLSADLTAATADGTTSPTGTDPGARRAALQKCAADAGVTAPKTATAEQKQQVLQCLKAAGFNGAKLGKANKPAIAAFLRRAVHGSFIVKGKDGKFVTVNADRGKEQSHTADSIVINRPDGQTVTVKLTSTTKYRGVTSASQLQDGRPTVVISDQSGNALVVGQRDAAAKGGATPNAKQGQTQGTAGDDTIGVLDAIAS
jgi:hypothetical protein